jgi:hypothetical protein
MQNSLMNIQRLKRMLKKAESRTREDERITHNKRAELLKSLRNDPAQTTSKASAGISSKHNAPRRRILQNSVPATQQSTPLPPAPTKQMVQTASSSASLQSILLTAIGNQLATNSHASLSSRKGSFELISRPHDAVPSGATNSPTLLIHNLDPTTPPNPFKTTCPIAYHYLQLLEHGDMINDWVSRKAFIGELDAVRIAMLEGCCVGSGQGGMRDLRAVQGIYCLVLGMGIWVGGG